MPSPFPGMDPYLESPDWFPDLRSSLIVHMKAQLNQMLPRPYYAQSDYRYWLEYTRHSIGPDPDVPGSARRVREPGGRERGAAEPRPPGPLIISFRIIEQGPFKQAFLEIRRRRGKGVRLVTAIEIPSPYDKEVDHPSRGQYIERQRKILGSDAHLVEIDLLREGPDTAAVTRDSVVAKAGRFDYLVSIHRYDRPNDFFVYPISMMERLPQIAIPLLSGDPDVPIDLQAAFDRAYDGGPYERGVEYGKDRIVPRLNPTQAAWAADLLAQRKHRA